MVARICLHFPGRFNRLAAQSGLSLTSQKLAFSRKLLYRMHHAPISAIVRLMTWRGRCGGRGRHLAPIDAPGGASGLAQATTGELQEAISRAADGGAAFWPGGDNRRGGRGLRHHRWPALRGRGHDRNQRLHQQRANRPGRQRPSRPPVALTSETSEQPVTARAMIRQRLRRRWRKRPG